jgi:putative FmdB family regulatory protein
MPLYEYECDACGERFERIQKFSDPLVEICPNCGKKKVKKLVSSPAIQFKGSGFYINDYARKGATGAEPPKTEPAETKSDDKPAATASSTATPPAPSPKEASTKESGSKASSTKE